MSSLISFLSSSIYIGLLIIHTLEYWQTISSHHYETTSINYNINTISQCKFIFYLFFILLLSLIVYRRLLVPFDEPATFANLALLITFTLALVQALLSMIGAVISCLWSPCCSNSVPNYTPITTNSHYAQTTPHRFEV